MVNNILKKSKMNFSDKMTLRFRKQGLSDNEIRTRLKKYYLFSKVALLIFLLSLVLLILRDRFKTENISVLVMFFIWFAVCIMMFLQLRKYTKINKNNN